MTLYSEAEMPGEAALCDHGRATMMGGVAANEVGLGAAEVRSLVWLCWLKVFCVDFSKRAFRRAPSVQTHRQFWGVTCHVLYLAVLHGEDD